MKIFRNVFRIGAVLSLALLMGVGLAYAQVSVSTVNGTTGPSSLNASNITSDHTMSVAIADTTAATQNFTAAVNAGNNVTTSNTTVGPEMGGNVVVTFGGIANPVVAPASIILPSMQMDNVNVSGGNVITGPNSSNVNTVSANSTNSVAITNNSTVSNTVAFSANTGANTTTNNTTVAGVQSGNVSLNASLPDNTASMINPIDLSGFGQGSVGATFTNNTTGPNSSNTNTLSANSSTTIAITSNNTLTNNVNLSANTGNNVVSSNTTVGPVSTGSVNFSVTQ